jgi:excinuclease UvrABC nuclease subunit
VQLSRRYKRVQEGRTCEMPDLVMIDGGHRTIARSTISGNGRA